MPKKPNILIQNKDIVARIKELAGEILQYYQKNNISDFSILWLEEGARTFVQELKKNLPANIEIKSVKVSSYGASMQSNGCPTIAGSLDSLKDKHVLLLDDIIETGATFDVIFNKLKQIGAKDVTSCFLLKKNIKNSSVNADFIGFEIEDLFVYGFGLDVAEKYRDLPDILYVVEENGKD